ncbi:MAG: 2-dehydro-3-deoxyphosphooctonate aldolase [Bacteroidota bacterium]
MNKILIIIGLTILVGCASKKNSATSSVGQGDTRTKPVEFINENTFLLTEISEDKSYGFDKLNPIKVGGEGGGPSNERKFLNALLGPNGEESKYFRAGSCCPFKTPNGLFDNMGLLDKYRVTWIGSKDTVTIFINMYDKGDLKIPVGLTAKKK